jgi:hypothetical protein
LEVRDPIHGAIEIWPFEIPFIDHLYFQRLRHLKQLGFAELSFPGATHNRYLHSLGVMQMSSAMFSQVFSGFPDLDTYLKRKFHQLVRLASLLHDIGHGPFSHSCEMAMPKVDELKIPLNSDRYKDRQATHEDYSLKILLDSDLTRHFEQAANEFGITSSQIASLVSGHNFTPSAFEHEGKNFFPLLHQIVSSEMDADRMDYLQRDSYFCGVSYGNFDASWLVRNLTYAESGQAYFLAVRSRAIYSFDDFLISRYHMFLMVYHHYKSVIYEAMLHNYFQSPDKEFHVPADPEKYLDCDDAMVFSTLRQSSNPWAKRIVERRPFKRVYENHFSTDEEVSHKMDHLEQDLKDNKIECIRTSSSGTLSKYTNPDGSTKHRYPIYVRSTQDDTTRPIELVTDLFKKYSKKRFISRIYVKPEQFDESRAILSRHGLKKSTDLQRPPAHRI